MEFARISGWPIFVFLPEFLCMARVTVEDCVERIPNRFQLVLIAAQRARNLSRGEEMTIDRDNDKNPVVALREIAEQTISIEKLELDLVKRHRAIRRAVAHSDDQVPEVDRAEEGYLPAQLQLGVRAFLIDSYSEPEGLFLCHASIVGVC